MISLNKANYDFKPVQFNCDDILGKHIKEPFPNKSFFLAIVGRPGSGKTSLLLNCLIEKGTNRVYNKVFDKIIYVCPVNSRKSIKTIHLMNCQKIKNLKYLMKMLSKKLKK